MPSQLLTDTVTFLFTDVEGSTALLRAGHEAYGKGWRSIGGRLRQAFASHGGVEVDTQGTPSSTCSQRPAKPLLPPPKRRRP